MKLSCLFYHLTNHLSRCRSSSPKFLHYTIPSEATKPHQSVYCTAKYITCFSALYFHTRSLLCVFTCYTISRQSTSILRTFDHGKEVFQNFPCPRVFAIANHEIGGALLDWNEELFIFSPQINPTRCQTIRYFVPCHPLLHCSLRAIPGTPRTKW